MSTTYTGKDLVERVVKALVGDEPQLITATGGSTSTIASTSAPWAKTSATAYSGLHAIVTRDADGNGAAPEGEDHVVTAYNSSTNTLTVTGLYTAAVASGDSVVLCPLSANQLFEAGNDILRNLPLPRYLPLTLCPDGDMETSSDGNWADVGSGTGTKVSTASRVLLRQALRVQGTSDGDGQRSDAINVFEGETLYVSVAIMCDEGQAEVELYDGSSVISGTSYKTNEEGYAEIRFQYSVDTGVETIQVQVTQDGATALDAYVGWVSVLSSERHLYDLPSTVSDAHHVDRLWFLYEGRTVDEDASLLWSCFIPQPYERKWRDFSGGNSHRIELEVYREGPIFIEFRATNTAITTMAGTFYASPDLMEAIVEGAVSECYKKLARSTTDDGRRAWYLNQSARAAQTYQTLLDSLSLARSQTVFQPQRRIAASSR